MIIGKVWYLMIKRLFMNLEK